MIKLSSATCGAVLRSLTVRSLILVVYVGGLLEDKLLILRIIPRETWEEQEKLAMENLGIRDPRIRDARVVTINSLRLFDPILLSLYTDMNNDILSIDSSSSIDIYD